MSEELGVFVVRQWMMSEVLGVFVVRQWMMSEELGVFVVRQWMMSEVLGVFAVSQWMLSDELGVFVVCQGRSTPGPGAQCPDVLRAGREQCQTRIVSHSVLQARARRALGASSAPSEL